jgi:hypothetical protein
MRGHEQTSSSDESDDELISETWPRRKRSALDDAMLTISGCSTWLENSRGRLNGFDNPNERRAIDGARESLSQRRDRAFARAWRVRVGPEAWQNLASAYAAEIEQTLEDENRLIDKRKTGHVTT